MHFVGLPVNMMLKLKNCAMKRKWPQQQKVANKNPLGLVLCLWYRQRNEDFFGDDFMIAIES